MSCPAYSYRSCDVISEQVKMKKVSYIIPLLFLVCCAKESIAESPKTEERVQSLQALETACRQQNANQRTANGAFRYIPKTFNFLTDTTLDQSNADDRAFTQGLVDAANASAKSLGISIEWKNRTDSLDFFIVWKSPEATDSTLDISSNFPCRAEIVDGVKVFTVYVGLPEAISSACGFAIAEALFRDDVEAFTPSLNERFTAVPQSKGLKHSVLFYENGREIYSLSCR